MRRAVAAIVVTLLVAIGVTLAVVSPPAQLSILDAALGGGIGVDRPGSAISFGTHGQTLDVWRPSTGPATAADRLPVLIFWYGGGWVKGDRRAYAFAARAFARAGFVVVVPDYRKVPQIRFPAMLQDGADAVRWTRDHIARFGGDPARIAIAGHSAGAYTVAMLALDQRWLTAAGVDPHVIKAAVGLSGPYNFYPFTAERAVAALGNARDPWMTQPITFARADAPPMLLVTSTRDTEVRPHNAFDLAGKLRRLGAPVRVIDYPGLTHENVAMALSVPFRGKATVLTDSIAFLRQALGDEQRDHTPSGTKISR